MLGLVLVLALGLGLSSPVAAEQQLHTATTVADTYIEEAYPDSDPVDNFNFGTSTELRVETGQRHRSLLRFDDFEPTVPAGSTATFISAQLELTVSSAYIVDSFNGTDISIHRVTEAWTETGATWNCSEDLLVNLGYPFPGCVTPWGTEGINGYGGGAYDPVAVDVQTITDFDTVVQFDVTAEVQSFLDGGVNNGWMVRLADESSADQFRFPSREAASGQPNLVLVYEVVADTIAPVIRHLEPLDGGFEVRGPRPDLTVEISDGGTGLAGDLAILLDGVDVTSTCVESVPEVPPGGGGSGDPGDGGALVSVTGEPAPGATITNVSAAAKVGTFLYTCTPTSDLPEGAHTLDVSISDLAGNVGSSNGTFVLLLGPGPHVRQLTAAEDATLLAESTTENRGSDITLEVQDTPVHRALVDFDLFAFEELVGKTTVSFDDASLELFAEGTADLPGPLTVGAYRLLQDWRESNVVWSCARDLSPEGECPQPWTGGNATATAEDTVTVDSATTGALSWTVTNDLSGGLLPAGSPQHPLFGWLLRFDPETGTPASATPPVATFTSREGAPAQAPTLTVTFTTPLLGDETPPDVVFVQPPSVTTDTSPPVSLTFTDDQSGVDAASFVLTLDGADITANCTVTAAGADCTTPVLTEASHTLVATLADLAGNGATTSHTFQVTSDVAPPVITLVAPAGTVYNDTAPTVEVAYSDDTSVDTATFTLTLDGVDVTANCAVGAASAVCTTSGLAQATHALVATVADGVGQSTSETFTFDVVLDTTVPSLAVTAPTGTVVDDTTPAVTVTFSDDNAGVDTSTLTVAVNGFDISGSCVLGSGTATCEPPALQEGDHTVTAQIADLAGNVATASGTFTVDLNLTDTVPPSLSVTAPVAPVTDDPAPAITVTYSDADSDVDLTTLDVAVDGFDLIADGRCTVGATSATCTPPLLGAGTHTVTTAIDDLAGNPATATASFDLSYTTPEATAPVVAITEPAETTVFDDLTPQITVEYSDADVAGSLTGVAILTLAVDVDGTDITAGCVVGDASAVCEPPPLTVDTHVVTATVEDLHGNLGTASFGFDIALTTPDTTAPTIAIAEPATTPVTMDVVPIRVTYADGETGVNLNSLAITLDGADITATCDVGATEATCTSPVLAEGSHTLDATVQDLAGNSASDSFVFEVVLGTLPQLVFVEPAALVVDDRTPLIVVQYSSPVSTLDLTTFVLTADGLDVTGTCTVGASEASCESPSLATGSHLLSASINDVDGSTGTQDHAFELQVTDTTPPITSIASPGPLVEDDSTPEVIVTYSDSESGVDLDSVEISLDGLSLLSSCIVTQDTATCEPPVLIEGNHLLQAEIADLAGNTTSASSSFEVSLDQEPPLLSIAAPNQTLLINDTAPEVIVEYSDAEAGIDLATLEVTIDGLDITASCTVAATSSSCLSPDVGAGFHVVAAEISDAVGNLALTSFTFTSVVDVTAPQLLLLQPTDGSTVDDATPRISLSYIDDGVGSRPETLAVSVDGVDILAECLVESSAAECETPPLSEGAHGLAVTIEDQAGNLASLSITFTVTLADLRAPTLTLTTPVGPMVVGDASPEIRAEYSDEGSGIAPSTFLVTLDGIDITSGCDVQSAEAVCEPPVLNEGFHILEVEIRDVQGNKTGRKESFDLVLMLPITIATPSSGTITQDATVSVTGTVAPEATEVLIGSVAASLAAGTFSADIPLHEGTNTLTAVARTANGGIGSVTVTVVRDTTVPRVVITSPPDGFVTTSSQVLFTGEFIEPASSGSEFTDPVVRVDGVPAQVENRTFFMPDHLLQPGENRIRVEAEDGAGNVGSAEVTVTLLTDPAQKIEELLGNGQTATVGQTLAKPLLVRVTDGIGNPLSERLVRFEVSRGDGTVRVGTEEGRFLTVRTDDLGRAQVDFTLGERAGMGNHEVTVTSVGFPGSLVFCASAEPLPADRVVRIQGNHQTAVLAGAVGEELPKPLFTQVFDAMDNPVAGVPVTYEVMTGGGTFGGASTFTDTTDNNGVATAALTLGSLPGVDINVVTASIPGSTGSPAVFNITGLEPGPEAQTSVSGIVLDNQDQPVPNATMSIVGTQLSTLTDAEGRFQIGGAPVGTVHLRADGTTVTLPGNWAVLEFEMVTVSGQNNGLGTPVRLLPIDAGVLAGGDEDVVIPLEGVPGATLTVFANSATFPDGSKEGLVSFTQVHNDKVPMVPPLGSTFAIALTIQPAGTLFDPPAQIQIPNPGHKLGEVVDIYSFDHDLGEFVPAGTGSVTPDGRFLRSNPGSGVQKAGWHGCVRPVPEVDACGQGNSGACTLCRDQGPTPKCDSCSVCTGSGSGALVNGLDGGPTTLLAAQTTTCEPKSVSEATIDPTPVITKEGEAVTLNAGSTDTCEDKEYVWSFGDGSQTETTKGSTTTHVYEEPGKYPVMVTVRCTQCGTASKASPPKDVRVVKVDLQLDGLPEEDEPEPNELNPGAFLGVPDDPGEGQLIPLSINFQGFGADSGELELTVGPGSGKVRVWQDSSKGAQVPLPKTWQISGDDVTESLFVEALQPSDAAQEIEFRLQYTNNETTAEDSSTLTTFEVQWVKPADSDIFAEGTEIRWIAKAKPQNIPGQPYTWAFSFTEGTANPATGMGMDAGGERHFDSTATSSGALRGRIELNVAGKSSTAERPVEVVRPQVTKISFLNDLPLHHWVNPNEQPPIEDPVWTQPLGTSSPTKNDPIAYVRSKAGQESLATVQLEVEADSELSDTAELRVRGKGQGATAAFEFMAVDGPAQSWRSLSSRLNLDSNQLAETNGAYDPLRIRWEYVVGKQDGSFPPWSEAVELGVSEHVLYRTFERPIFGSGFIGPIPFEFDKIYDIALQKACKEYARDLADRAAIAGALMSGIDNDLCYDPGGGTRGGNPLVLYGLPGCQCSNNADLMVMLANTVGIEAQAKVFYGGDLGGTLALFGFHQQVGTKEIVFPAAASAQFDRPAHDRAVEDPHFKFHVQTLIDGVYYDPSYGLEGRAAYFHLCGTSGFAFLEDVDFFTYQGVCKDSEGEDLVDPHTDAEPGVCPN